MIDRRRLLAALPTVGASLATLVGSGLTAPTAQALLRRNRRTAADYVRLLTQAPRLFCIAYIDPTIREHQGQEATIARFPLALVPQDERNEHRYWRDRIRKLNPDIILLGYQMTIEETTVPGPGHDVLRADANVWVKGPTGSPLTIEYAGRPKKVFDSSSRQWQDAFVRACRKTLESYPFDGLFLDQCTVYTRAYAHAPWRKDELEDGLQQALLGVRSAVGDALVIGNSGRDWAGLNGEMCEGRIKDFADELATNPAHAKPEVNLGYVYLDDAADEKTVTEFMEVAHRHGGWFGAAVTPQQVLWFDAFSGAAAAS